MNPFLLTLAVTPLFFLCPVNGDSKIAALSSQEIEKLYKEGKLKEVYNTAFRKFQERERVENIYGFVCSCLLIRDLTEIEYDIAEQVYPDESCAETWKLYIQRSRRRVAAQLRRMLKPMEYKACGHALCDTGFKCNKHARNNWETVQVLSLLKDGTNDTIHEILKQEKPKFLLTPTEMKYVNMFGATIGESPFVFDTFVKNGKKFAVPYFRSSNDIKNCPLHFCE